MSKRLTVVVMLVTIGCFGVVSSTSAGESAVPELGRPLPRAHAHNDYEHERPLFDALSHGFCSIEADVHLVEGQLLVAHDIEEVRPDRTLERLYLSPLHELVQRNGGKVYPDGPTIFLLIDLKTPAVRTYEALKPLLERYGDMLTEFRKGKMNERALTVIISGNRPVQLLEREELRYAAIDGRLRDLDANPPTELVPLVSEDWTKHFEWQGTGPFPEAEAAKLRDMLQQVHAQKRKLRFWATPERPEMWDALLAAEVDLIGADNLERLAEYLNTKAAASP